MTYTAPSVRLWLRLAFLLLLAIALPQGALAQGREQSLTTQYFTIFYPPGEEQTAQWYATFADEVNTQVSQLLGAKPISGLTLHIYASEPEYWKANPMAQMHPGILAHAVPERKEVGVAVERLRQQPPELARESFRHVYPIAQPTMNHNLPRLPLGLAITRASVPLFIDVVNCCGASEAANFPYYRVRLNTWEFRRTSTRLPQSLPLAFLATATHGSFARFLSS